jgi:hypothetical protein
MEFKNRLNPGEVLEVGDMLVSEDTLHELTLEDDGNLVLRDIVAPLWSSNMKYNPKSKNYQCVMKRHGRLVIHDNNGNDLWVRGNRNNPGSYLIIQNDANLVLYNKKNKPIWSSKTHFD